MRANFHKNEDRTYPYLHRLLQRNYSNVVFKYQKEKKHATKYSKAAFSLNELQDVIKTGHV